MFHRRLHRALFVMVLASSALALAGAARAQCLITGPTQMCGSGPVTLCGDTGWDAYAWTLPDGSIATTQCISARLAGTYSLSVYDALDDLWFGPCSQTLTSSAVVAATITGPTSGCAGTSLSLCGPGGSLTYAWTGPAGFTGSTMCVNVNASGAYALSVRSLSDSCWSAPDTANVAFSTCNTAPVVNCPRPAWWWQVQCLHRAAGPLWLTAQQVDAVASCVTDQDASLRGLGSQGPFCVSMRDDPHSLRGRAIREVAAVWSNICAGQLGIAPAGGAPVSLNPSSPLTLPSARGTISGWLAHANMELASLRSASTHDRAARRTYQDVIRVAWCINHGVGIGPTCALHPDDDSRAQPGGTTAMATPVLSSDGVSIPVDPQEPLSVQLLDDSDGPLSFGTLEPNPFSTETRLAYSISSPTQTLVTIGVYDISGRLVRELVNAPLAAGQYEARWDGHSTDGSPARSGLYFILGRIGGQQVQTRVTVVR